MGDEKEYGYGMEKRWLEYMSMTLGDQFEYGSEIMATCMIKPSTEAHIVIQRRR